MQDRQEGTPRKRHPEILRFCVFYLDLFVLNAIFPTGTKTSGLKRGLCSHRNHSLELGSLWAPIRLGPVVQDPFSASYQRPLLGLVAANNRSSYVSLSRDSPTGETYGEDKVAQPSPHAAIRISLIIISRARGPSPVTQAQKAGCRSPRLKHPFCIE